MELVHTFGRDTPVHFVEYFCLGNLGSGTLGSNTCGNWDFQDAVSPSPSIDYISFIASADNNSPGCINSSHVSPVSPSGHTHLHS